MANVPLSTRTPGQYIGYDLQGARASAPQVPLRCLLIGYGSSSGTAAKDTPHRLTVDTQAVSYFGAGSELHRMVLAAIGVTPHIELWGAAVTEAAAGAAASATLTFAVGDTPAAGTVVVEVGADIITVPFTATMTAAEIAAATVTALAAKAAVWVTAAAGEGESTHVVTLTYRTKGTSGNLLSLAVSMLDGGTVSVTASGATLADGTGAMEIAALLDEIKGERYDLKGACLGSDHWQVHICRTLREVMHEHTTRSRYGSRIKSN